MAAVKNARGPCYPLPKLIAANFNASIFLDMLRIATPAALITNQFSALIGSGPFDATLKKKYPVSTRESHLRIGDQEYGREISIAGPTLRLF